MIVSWAAMESAGWICDAILKEQIWDFDSSGYILPWLAWLSLIIGIHCFTGVQYYVKIEKRIRDELWGD